MTRRWRRVQAIGGFALACSFFLPAVRSCNSTIVPAWEVADFLGERSTALGEWAGVFVIYVAAYIYGLLTVVISIRLESREVDASGRSGLSVGVLLGGVVAVVLVGVIADLRSPSPIDLASGFFILAVLISCAYWLRSVQMGAGGLLCLRWYTALACCVWFGFWVGGALYGLWISFCASLLILLGLTQEARIRRREGLRRALVALLTARLVLYDNAEPRCVECGYLLYGLTSPRCPECGRSIERSQGPDPRREAPAR